MSQSNDSGLRENIQCYLQDLDSGTEDLLTRMNIEEHLVDVARYEDAVNAKTWAFAALSPLINTWHPKARSLVQFIEMQIAAKSFGHFGIGIMPNDWP